MSQIYGFAWLLDLHILYISPKIRKERKAVLFTEQLNVSQAG